MTVQDIRSTCPRDCYDACGIRIVTEANGHLRVTGDAGHPGNRGSLCGKCTLAYNGVWQDPKARLTVPLKRVGAKGEAQFEEVSWDEALAAVGNHLQSLIAGGRAHDILTAHYTGTCSVIANQFPMRFFRAIGATDIEPDTICNLSGHVALNYVTGNSVLGFDPRTAKDAAALIVWGANPSASGPHVDKHWLAEFPGKLVVIDPILTPTAERADLHLRPFPGTDAALAFGMLHFLHREGKLNRDFIEAHTLGYDELEPLILDWPPARAAEVTGIAVADIERAADIYASGPALLWLGQALCRAPAGGNAFRAAAMLPAVTGNIGKPGTGLYFLNGKGATLGLDSGYVATGNVDRATGGAISHMHLVSHLQQTPADKALFVWNMNIAASNPDQRRLHQQLQSEDLFLIVADLFMTDTARYADYVLPAASFLEFDDLVGSYFHLSLNAQCKAMEPLGQARPNQEIFRGLARAMGLTAPELFEEDDAILAHLLTPLGLSFDGLKESGVWFPGEAAEIFWKDFRFATPSGHIEIASARAEADGHPRTPVPVLQEGAMGAVSSVAGARNGETLFRLLTPADEWHMNHSYDNEPRIRARTDPAEITLHPTDAEALGLTAGAMARIWNDAGELTLKVVVSAKTLPGVLWAPKGRWPSFATEKHNVNVLNPGLVSDMGQSTALHGIEVNIMPA